MNATAVDTQSSPGKVLRVALWVAQIILAALFCMIGLWKISTPITELAAAIKWPGEFPPLFVRALGFIDLAGGLGVLLPAVTRILPRLAVFAVMGCILLQIIASLFHISRGEISVLPLNVVLLALAIFVLWGRTQRVPILPR